MMMYKHPGTRHLFIMAPGKKKTSRKPKNRSVKNEKLASFIKDFDSQVKIITEEMKASVVNILKEVDSQYNIEIIKLPMAIREMCWLDYIAKGGSQKALEAAATVKVDMEEITSTVTKTPFKADKKVKKRKCKPDDETVELNPLKSVIRTKTKAKVAAKKPSTARRTRASVGNVANTSKRTSKRGRATPSASKQAETSLLGYTPAATPRIDTSIFKTPALRTPCMQEPVYTFSANGSPLAGMDELFINVPARDGKIIRLLASEVDGLDINRLDQQAFENIKLLSSRLERLCKKLK
ncbi:borealin isoform X1 [Xenopus laevis]|uniref:Borealin n=3 Tax=Xenopus laevis TaxID=8355 RepID=A0A8J0UAW0_XENLA|nr:borealin isoform X1 [Xenopus laevis]